MINQRPGLLKYDIKARGSSVLTISTYVDEQFQGSESGESVKYSWGTEYQLTQGVKGGIDILYITSLL